MRNILAVIIGCFVQDEKSQLLRILIVYLIYYTLTILIGIRFYNSNPGSQDTHNGLYVVIASGCFQLIAFMTSIKR